MVRRCCLCRKTGNQTPRLHAFPKNEQQRRNWACACAVPETADQKFYVCSNHFKATDYKVSFNGRYLRADVFPSLLLPIRALEQVATSAVNQEVNETNQQIDEKSAQLEVFQQEPNHVMPFEKRSNDQCHLNLQSDKEEGHMPHLNFAGW